MVGGGGWFMKSMECCDLLSICFPNVSKDAYRLFGLLDILILRCLSSTVNNSVDNLHEFQCEITPYKNKLRKNWKTLLIHFEKVFVIYYSKRWFICIICRREKHMRLFESGGSLRKSDNELWNCWNLSIPADSTLY